MIEQLNTIIFSITSSIVASAIVVVFSNSIIDFAKRLRVKLGSIKENSSKNHNDILYNIVNMPVYRARSHSVIQNNFTFGMGFLLIGIIVETGNSSNLGMTRYFNIDYFILFCYLASVFAIIGGMYRAFLHNKAIKIEVKKNN
jgi:hypothetical protein